MMIGEVFRCLSLTYCVQLVDQVFKTRENQRENHRAERTPNREKNTGPVAMGVHVDVYHGMNFENEPVWEHQTILVRDWLITSHVTQITRSDWLITDELRQ